MAGKSSKMLQHINYRMRCTLQDGRTFIGLYQRWPNDFAVATIDVIVIEMILKIVDQLQE